MTSRSELGNFLKLSVRGASHAPSIGFSLANFPAGFRIDADALKVFMERRAPGRDGLSTPRREPDAVVFDEGVTDGVTTGGKILGHIDNLDIRPGDYGAGRTVPRPGHADWPQYVRYGRIPSGGGANSGRMTAAYCAAGGICLQYLAARGFSVEAKIDGCGDIWKAKKAGDSVGGIIRCEIRGVPAGLGGAMFDGLDGDLVRAVFAIPGVKGVEFGSGFAACGFMGSRNNDAFTIRNGEVRTRTNNHGGILGGFSSGMPIVFRVAMKPTPTVFTEQESVDLATMKSVKLAMKGRHDPCIVRRAVPVVEAMAAFAVADALLYRDDTFPRLCLTLTGKTLAEDLAQYRSQKFFTDLVELRVDLLDRSELASAAEFPELVPLPVVLTCRRKGDGGAWSGSERSRAALFRRLLAKGRFAYVDFEADFHCCDKFTNGARVVRSIHRFDGRIPEVWTADGEILKLAVKGKDVSVGVKLIRKFADDPREHVVMQMGYEGFFTRALAGASRSKWVYCSTGGLAGLGHVTPEELVRDFRIRDFGTAGNRADLFGVTGWPLKTTRSPELHNAAFFAEGREALMVPIPCADIRKALKAAAALGMRGLAVTIPHKETVLPLLDEIDPVAKAVGAVNTVRRTDDGGLHGYNTDVAGFTRAFAEFTSAVPGAGSVPLKVALLGAGGAAKACRYALKKLGCKVETFHRRPLTDGFKVIVNATPVDPIPEYVFRGDELVFDLRYVPEVTDLMSRAAKAGCRVCNGFTMLKYQAEEQRRIWER